MHYKNIYKKFASLEGSDHIASEFALKGIEKLILKNNVKTVFELGIGIGTIPYLIKKIDRNIFYVGTEGNPYCIEQLNKNLSEVMDNQLLHFSSTSEIDKNLKFDLIIIDGKFDNTDFIKSITHTNSIILIEGDRKEQRDVIQDIFPNYLVSRCITNKRNYTWGPFVSGYMGGYTLYRLNYKSFKNRVAHLRERISTSLLYRLRKYLM
jgi:hypothetical protein